MYSQNIFLKSHKRHNILAVKQMAWDRLQHSSVEHTRLIPGGQHFVTIMQSVLQSRQNSNDQWGYSVWKHTLSGKVVARSQILHKERNAWLNLIQHQLYMVNKVSMQRIKAFLSCYISLLTLLQNNKKLKQNKKKQKRYQKLGSWHHTSVQRSSQPLMQYPLQAGGVGWNVGQPWYESFSIIPEVDLPR